MSMNKNFITTALYNSGRADALALRAKAVAGELTDTEIIDNEQAIPEYDAKKDYSNCVVDTPVKRNGQVYGLIQPHNAAHYTDVEPGTAGGAALWRLKHTTNPAKAKPWVTPDAANPYKAGECMIWTDGVTKRALRDTVYSPEEYAPDWEDVVDA